MKQTHEVTEARLRACLHYAAQAVPDAAPPFDPGQPLRLTRSRTLQRRTFGMAAVAVVVIALVMVGLGLSFPGPTARGELIAATHATIAAQTARVRLTSVPSAATEIGHNAVAATATGVVDFAVPAMEAKYPDGFGWVDIGVRSWHTAWPPSGGHVRWVRDPSPTEPSHTSPAQRRLDQALQADTGPAALLAALRADTTRISELGAGKVDGLRAAHYRAVVGNAWSADVWVARAELVRVQVEGPSGSVTEEYFDYGLPVDIKVPPGGP